MRVEFKPARQLLVKTLNRRLTLIWDLLLKQTLIWGEN